MGLRSSHKGQMNFIEWYTLRAFSSNVGMMNSFSSNDVFFFVECLRWLVSALLFTRSIMERGDGECWSCIQALLLHMRSSRHYCSNAQSFLDSQRKKNTRKAQASVSRFLNQQIEFALLRFVLTVDPAHLHDADVMHVIESRIISEWICVSLSLGNSSRRYISRANIQLVKVKSSTDKRGKWLWDSNDVILLCMARLDRLRQRKWRALNQAGVVT